MKVKTVSFGTHPLMKKLVDETITIDRNLLSSRHGAIERICHNQFAIIIRCQNRVTQAFLITASEVQNKPDHIRIPLVLGYPYCVQVTNLDREFARATIVISKDCVLEIINKSRWIRDIGCLSGIQFTGPADNHLDTPLSACAKADIIQIGGGHGICT